MSAAAARRIPKACRERAVLLVCARFDAPDRSLPAAANPLSSTASPRLVSKTASAKVVIANRLGLHARPAMVFVEAAMKFKAEITVRRTDQDETIDGKSIMQMMMLAATQGTELEIVARNEDCDDAVNELVELVKNKFQEE